MFFFTICKTSLLAGFIEFLEPDNSKGIIKISFINKNYYF